MSREFMHGTRVYVAQWPPQQKICSHGENFSCNGPQCYRDVVWRRGVIDDNRPRNHLDEPGVYDYISYDVRLDGASKTMRVPWYRMREATVLDLLAEVQDD